MKYLTKPPKFPDFSFRSPQAQDFALMRIHPQPTAEILLSPSGGDPVESFFIDFQNIINCDFYRRLKGKTQNYNDTLHTRGPHTTHVATTGRQIARELGLGDMSQDLIAAICNMHDIGHPPFAHDGEKALRIKAKQYGSSWDHDMAGLNGILKVAVQREEYDGLNLTADVVRGALMRYWRHTPDESVVETNPHYYRHVSEIPSVVMDIHNNLLVKQKEWIEANKARRAAYAAEAGKPYESVKYDEPKGLHLFENNHIEGQIAATADWIAFYCVRCTWMAQKKNDQF